MSYTAQKRFSEHPLAVRTVLEFPHPALRRKAKRVRKIDRSIQELADDMIDTLHEVGGVGLAANQVGDLRRVIVIHLTDEEEPRAYINPEIVHREGEREIEEACLSVPGYHGFVTRAIWVKARGLDRHSNVFRIRAEGLLAQALEHEIDHLDGILYFDHLQSHQSLIPNETPPEIVEAEPAAVGEYGRRS